MINEESVIMFANYIRATADNAAARADAEKILLLVSQGRYGTLARRIDIALSNSRLTHQDLLEVFSEDDLADIFDIPYGRRADNYDYTSTRRARNRRAILNDKARALGFDSLSEFETAWKNDVIQVAVRRQHALE